MRSTTGTEIRALRVAAAVLAVMALTPAETTAQAGYPNKPVTIIVAQSAGSPTDILARSLADQFSKSLHQTFVVVNRDGAAGTIGVEAVKQATADGYTLGYGTQGPFSIQPNLRKVMRYKADDFEFVCQTNDVTPMVVVGLNSPYHTLAELIEAARKAPGTVTLGSVGIGSGPHIIGEGIGLDANVRFNHIPFRSFGDLNTQIVAGNVDFTVTAASVRQDVRPLAATGNNRLANYPDLPLLKDLGYKRGGLPGFIGLYAPKGTPAAALEHLRAACPGTVASDGFKTASDATASPREYADSATYSENIRQDQKSMTALISALGIKPDQ